MSTVERAEESWVRFYPRGESWKRARPLPPPAQLVAGDWPDDRWTALRQALAEA